MPGGDTCSDGRRADRQVDRAESGQSGLDEARVVGRGVEVWALVGYVEAYRGDLARVARAFDLPVEAVEAALAYYRAHRCAIDNRIAANVA